MAGRGATNSTKNGLNVHLPPSQLKSSIPPPFCSLFEIFQVPPCWRGDVPNSHNISVSARLFSWCFKLILKIKSLKFELSISWSWNVIYFAVIVMPKKSHYYFCNTNLCAEYGKTHVSFIYIVGIMFVR